MRQPPVDTGGWGELGLLICRLKSLPRGELQSPRPVVAAIGLATIQGRHALSLTVYGRSPKDSAKTVTRTRLVTVYGPWG